MAERKPRPRNPLSDLFEAAFLAEQQARGIADPVPYLREVHDYIQLDALCKKGDELQWTVTAERFGRALENYFRSEVGVRTLADLSVKFSAYYRSPLDKFGQPLTKPGGHSEMRFRSMQEVKSAWEIKFLYKVNEVWAARSEKRDMLETLLEQCGDEHLSEVEAYRRLERIEKG